MTKLRVSDERLRELIERKLPPALHGMHEQANECMSCDLVFALRELQERRGSADPARECICPACGLRHGGSNVDGGF